MDPCALVRDSCKELLALPESQRLVQIHAPALDALVAEVRAFVAPGVEPQTTPIVPWNSDGIHYDDVSQPELLATYLFVLDSLNFCFWPCLGLEYHHLSLGLRTVLEKDPQAFSLDSLAKCTPQTVKLFFTAHGTPEGGDVEALGLELRATMIRQHAYVLQEEFGGSVLNLIAAAKGSGVRLVHLMTSRFLGFQDHTVCSSSIANRPALPVYFYKRAQIFVADLWGAFRGQGIGSFSDIASLTMFADYRVPQMLHHMGALTYSDALTAAVQTHVELPAGSIEELAIRASAVVAVEYVVEQVWGKYGVRVPSIVVDWLLWQRGEALVLAGKPIIPHHRTKTMWY
jgi:hypothetical protein